jgi:N,N'-diacetyllegionaminate synthase
MKARLIAEIGANHMGDMAIAHSMVDAAAKAGADTVKFQSWRPEKLAKDFPNYETTYERHSRTQLTDDQHRELIDYCRDKDVAFLTTCFDTDRAGFLASLGLEEVKVASPDCGSIRMIEELMKHFPRLIISTGMTPDEEVLETIEATRGHDVVFLHCVSLYPTPPEQVNLARMDWLHDQGVRVGFSDHTHGAQAPMLAIARGAEIIEKHFTVSQWLPGKDQQISSEPDVFREIADWIGLCETMTGSEHPGLSDTELQLRDVYVGKWGANN